MFSRNFVKIKVGSFALILNNCGKNSLKIIDSYSAQISAVIFTEFETFETFDSTILRAEQTHFSLRLQRL